MIHVVLDSSIYRAKPRLDSPEFKALSFLAKKQCVLVHIPYVVEHEFSSFLVFDHRHRLEKAIKTTSNLSIYQKLKEFAPQLNNISVFLKDNLGSLSEETKESFVDWAISINAKRYGLCKSQAEKALDAYFYGKPPFKEAKNRNDIPDSFIYQSVCSLHAEHPNNLHFVVNDGNLHGACLANGIIVHKSLEEFVNIKELKECLKNALIEDNNATISEQLIKFAETNSEEVLDKIESTLLGDEYRLISGHGIPGESGEIYVSGVNRPTALSFTGDVEHYGEGLFVLPFYATVELIYEYAVYRSDAYDLDETKYHIEYLNDHYVNVETTDEFNFSGRLELEYDVNLGALTSPEELLAALKHPAISISELSDFEIQDT